MLDLLGDIGGLSEALVILFSILLFSYPLFSFNIKALEKLFIAKTFEIGILDQNIQAKKKNNKSQLKFKMLKIELPKDIKEDK